MSADDLAGMPARVIAQHQSDMTDDELDAPLHGYKLNYWAQSMADRGEAPEFQMKQEEFIFYLRGFS